jgi:hypothetical protein
LYIEDLLMEQIEQTNRIVGAVRAAERGVLVPGAIASDRDEIEASSERSERTSIEQAFIETTHQAWNIIQPTLTEPKDRYTLDRRIEQSLFNDDLFDLFFRLGLQNVNPAAAAGLQLVDLEPLVGHMCRAKVEFMVSASFRAVWQLTSHFRTHAPTDLLQSELLPMFAGENLLRPSLYMSNRILPPEIRRVLFARDVAQVTFPGIALAREWALSKVRVAELCECFIENQTRWLEFMNGLPGVTVPDEALPSTRTNFAQAWEETLKANTAIERASDHLERSGEPAFFFGDRDSDESKKREG